VTPEERMAVTASRLLADHRTVFAGVGMPLLASGLARRRQAPHLTIVLEGGIIGTRLRPGQLPVSTNEMRAAYGAPMLTDITDIFLYAQRGFFDYGFLGAAQVDRYGNINTSFIGDPDQPKVRLPGSGGAADIICLCREIFIVTSHERRRFVDAVDFITSPGYLAGGDSRRAAHFRVELAVACWQGSRLDLARGELEHARTVLEPEGASEELITMQQRFLADQMAAQRAKLASLDEQIEQSLWIPGSGFVVIRDAVERTSQLARPIDQPEGRFVVDGKVTVSPLAVL